MSQGTYFMAKDLVGPALLASAPGRSSFQTSNGMPHSIRRYIFDCFKPSCCSLKCDHTLKPPCCVFHAAACNEASASLQPADSSCANSLMHLLSYTSVQECCMLMHDPACRSLQSGQLCSTCGLRCIVRG